MARRFEMTDEPWIRIEPLLPGRADTPGVTARDHRNFVDAVLGIARTGAGWRDLPERFGDWNNTFQRFHRWAQSGVWARVREALGGDADLEHRMIDATVIRAHQHAAGAEKQAATRPSAARVVE